MDTNALNNSSTEIANSVIENTENIVNAKIMINKPTTSTTFNNINSINSVDYMTLEIMANSDTYNKYLKRHHLDHDSVLKKEKKFYRKRIISMTKDILFNSVSKNDKQENDGTTNDLSKIDDVIINAFNTYARLCITYFKFKDTMDTIQGEYKDMNDSAKFKDNIDEIEETEDLHNQDNDDNEDNIMEVNKLFMKQIDKKVITLDNFVIKTSAPKEEMILPKTKDYNLNDPKFKKKDIKKFGSTSSKINKDNVNTSKNTIDAIVINKKTQSDIEILLDKNINNII
jgi:hypothetical protein